MSTLKQPGSNWRQAAAMAVGFVAVLYAGDRVLSRLHLPDIYGTRNGCRLAWDRFEQSKGPYNVVYLGCSYEWYGISPRVVDAQASRLSGMDVRSLNLSSSAASMVTNYLLARRIVESGRLPKVVYLDVSPDATDVSQRNWLRHGLRALGDIRDLPVAASVGRDVIVETLLSATFSSYCRWDDMGIAAGRVVLAAPVHPTLKMRFDDRGWAEWIGGKRELPAFAPSILDAPASNRGSWGTPRSGDPNAVALRRTIEMLQAAGVTVRLLEMPMASVAPPWDRHDRNHAYRAFVNAAIEGLDVRIVRPPAEAVVDADFFDPIHLNPEGAAKFSRWLADDVVEAVSASASNPVHDAMAKSRNANGQANEIPQ